jgi:hypothetical protein
VENASSYARLHVERAPNHESSMQLVWAQPSASATNAAPHEETTKDAPVQVALLWLADERVLHEQIASVSLPLQCT